MSPSSEDSDPKPTTHRKGDLKVLSGRGAVASPHVRFERIAFSESESQLEEHDEFPTKVKTDYYDDASQSIVSENQSPDLGFRFSINPYRGCLHGCSYCYARPTHEYLGLNCGLDFETKILVKRNAAQLFRKWLAKKSWVCEPIMFSGVTDPYQPIERKLELTRECLQVALACRQPVMLITKNALIARDADLLQQLAEKRLVSATISITSQDQSLIRVMEPRTSSPQARFSAIQKLAEVGVPVNVNVAPIIPGLNDAEVPEILRVAKEHGASTAAYIVLRLPYAVKDVFLDWVDVHFPDKRSLVENRIRITSDNKLNRSEFRERMTGTGPYAEQIRATFKVFQRRYGLDLPGPKLATDLFRRPDPSGQLSLFE